MACPAPDTLQALVAGALDAGARDAVTAHLDGCEACRQSAIALVADGRDGRPRAPVAGTQLGRYIVDEVVGTGAMGVVYAAHDPGLDRRVAIKLLHAELAVGAEGESRLVSEAKALARVRHPAVVTVHDIGTWEGRVFVAMELVEGTTLRAWLAERRRTWREVLALLVDAGRGLAAAHAANVVHRDFKPENVLVTQDGRATVSDFGLARVGAGGGRAGDLVGTPAYMPPEQLAGEEIGPAADQFAYCATLYEAIHGVRPFRGASVGELAEAIASRRLERGAAAGDVPAWLAAAIERGLAARPADRHASMAALVDVLARRRGSRRVVAAGALAAGALAVAVWGVATRERSAPPPRELTMHRLTSGAAEFIAGAAISPDGRSVAYVNADGTRVRDIASGDTRVLSREAAAGVAWSPDGTRLAVSTDNDYLPDDDDEIFELATTGGAGGARRHLALGIEPAYSPDGAQLAYIGRRAIWVARADGSAPRRLVELGNERAFGLAWSPDSAQLAFVRTDFADRPRAATLYAVDRAGAVRALLADPHLSLPGGIGGVAWHTDGRIVYLLYDDASGTPSVTVWELDPASPRTPPVKRASWAGFRARTFTLSPRTGQLAYVHSAGSFDIFAGELAAGPPPRLALARITDDEADDFSAAFVDDRRVVFASARAGTSDIYEQAIDERTPQRLLGGASSQQRPEPTPDGRAILYWDDARRLMRWPRGGGEPHELVTLPPGIVTGGGLSWQGAWSHCTARCVLAERRAGRMTFSELDPDTGRGRALATVASTTEIDFDWALARDGATVALPEDELLRAIALAGGSERSWRLPGVVQGVAWLPDGRLLASTFASTPRPLYQISIVDPASGAIVPVWTDATSGPVRLAVSRDGRSVAATMRVRENTLWLVDGL